MAKRYDSWKDYPKQRDEQGRWLCRNCGAPLVGRRTSWCSKACMREVEIRCGTGVRRAVWLRDKSVCSRCGRDTNAIRRRLREIKKTKGREAWLKALKKLKLTTGEALRTLWQAHHAEAVEEGGGGCGVEGYETLCVWCHKVENAKQHRRKRDIVSRKITASAGKLLDSPRGPRYYARHKESDDCCEEH